MFGLNQIQSKYFVCADLMQKGIWVSQGCASSSESSLAKLLLLLLLCLDPGAKILEVRVQVPPQDGTAAQQGPVHSPEQATGGDVLA